ncbi:MAG: ferritin-like domain-containing protein [Gammaproteobacteria bacterium]|nr:ferritin-like domain-containing protein [Gammaproteobacteria bacterium]
MNSGLSRNARIARLIPMGGGEALADAANLAWREGPRPPRWLSRQRYAGIVSDLRYGELVTARACTEMASLIPDNAAVRGHLEGQRADELAHAALYERYLRSLDAEDRVNPALEQLYQRCLDWSGDPLGLVLAFNVVLEGEALRLQRFLATRLPCPLFSALNRRILMDEARHVAFGRIYGGAGVPSLDAEERIALYRWLKALWWDFGCLLRDSFGGPGGRLLRALQPTLEESWDRQAETLLRLGLLQPDERIRAEGR